MMLKKKLGRSLISVVLVTTAVVSVAVDWNASHIFNFDWTPHARFHDVVMLHLLSGVCILGLWLMWRRCPKGALPKASPEPEIGVRVAALIPVIFWAAFFYTTFLFPGTGLSASPDEVPPSLLGIPMYPSVIVAAICVGLSVLGYWLYRSGSAVDKSSREAT